MKATETFEKLIKELSNTKQAYIRTKLNEYNRICTELFYNKIFNFPYIVNLVQKETIDAIVLKLETKDQITFLKNVVKGQTRPFIKGYNLLKRKNLWQKNITRG